MIEQVYWFISGDLAVLKLDVGKHSLTLSIGLIFWCALNINTDFDQFLCFVHHFVLEYILRLLCTTDAVLPLHTVHCSGGYNPA